MLWSDGIFISVADLTAIDPEVPTIATTEGITLTGDSGFIKQGIDEAALELRNMLLSFDGYISTSGITATHMAAVNNTGGSWQMYQRIQLGQIVVTTGVPSMWSAIKRWAVYRVLQHFYTAITERKVIDRYQNKLDRTREAIEKRYEPFMFNSGIPIIEQPLHRPAAGGEPNSGTWGAANLSDFAGGSAQEAIWDVAISFTGTKYKTQLDRQNQESAPSDILTYKLAANRILIVDITSVKPVNAQPNETKYWGGYTPIAATGWNIWAGTSGGTMYLQTATPVAIATKSYMFVPLASPATKYAMHEGQYPEKNWIIAKTLFRG